ncbi:putative Diguanylate cyclase [Georgfuchsia toluolica]|uniref:diguanylate cyclase n=1 Tax=Georgfuchsia toluolica TaxID=424218 RepID=A0A916J6H8_9PROT|nr:diguanylate cyclase [Georgfuchsia toluolica]CAG4884900.1 putative Diguanylate cyclase [Georgfuchsia toluolica]
MDTFVWDKHFTTGLETVDQQHHHLVDLVNQLGESLIAGEVQGPEALQAIFGQLADYAQYHFAEEECLMQETGVDLRHRDTHCQCHVQFVEQILTMWDSRSSMANPAEILHGFLFSWLGFHILGEDQTMARQIALIRAGKSPDQACDIEMARTDDVTAALLQALRNLYHVLSVQNRDLAATNLGLEKMVAERTAELTQANQALTNLNQHLDALSNSDSLLGIANRRYFDSRLEKEWRGVIREQSPLSLLLIDVDYFKHFNDCYGHQAGDHCLQSVVKAAQIALKRPGDLLARYGGDELAVILPNTELDGAILVAQAIQRELAEQHIPHANSPLADLVTLSIGAAMMIPDEQSSAIMLVAATDRGLYVAKKSGRNRICSG